MPAARTSPTETRPALTEQQVMHWRTFGFVKLPGFFAQEFDTIVEGFEEAFESEPNPTILDPSNPFHESPHPGFEGNVRGMVPFFIDRSPKLAWIRDDPRVVDIATRLLGEGYEYAESDGNRFNCDVYWHIDAYGAPIDQLHLKMYVYLESLDGSTGALRVIPGSNHYKEAYAQTLYRLLMGDPSSCGEVFGVALDEIPSWTLDVEPGDVILGNFRTLHGSFGGPVGRRLFTVNFREATGI